MKRYNYTHLALALIHGQPAPMLRKLAIKLAARRGADKHAARIVKAVRIQTNFIRFGSY